MVMAAAPIFCGHAIQGPAMLFALWKEGHPVQKLSFWPPEPHLSSLGAATKTWVRSVRQGRQLVT